MSPPAVNGPGSPTDPYGYARVIADVSHLTEQLRLALGAACRCRPGRETATMIGLHHQARGIAARLNQALADTYPTDEGR